jgi:hypothetical protein
LSDELPNEAVDKSWMAFYIRKRKFAECVILGWQSVENYINQMILQEFELPYLLKDKPRIDFVLDQAFPAKLELLKSMGRISKNDKETIQRFSEERNKLFHGGFFLFDHPPHPSAMPEEEKTRLMELANRASQIVVNRGFEVWVDEGTGDIGNKNVPKPIGPEGVKRRLGTKG